MLVEKSELNKRNKKPDYVNLFKSLFVTLFKQYLLFIILVSSIHHRYQPYLFVYCSSCNIIDSEIMSKTDGLLIGTIVFVILGIIAAVVFYIYIGMKSPTQAVSANRKYFILI